VVFIRPFFGLVVGRNVSFISVDRYGHFGGTFYLVLMSVRTYRNTQHHRSKLLPKRLSVFWQNVYCSAPACRQIDTLPWRRICLVTWRMECEETSLIFVSIKFCCDCSLLNKATSQRYESINFCEKCAWTCVCVYIYLFETERRNTMSHYVCGELALEEAMHL